MSTAENKSILLFMLDLILFTLIIFKKTTVRRTCDSLCHDLGHLAARRDDAHAGLVNDQHFPLSRLH